MNRAAITVTCSLVTVGLGVFAVPADASARGDLVPCYTRVWYTYDPCSYLDIQNICDTHCGFAVQYWSCQNSTPHHGALTIKCFADTGEP